MPRSRREVRPQPRRGPGHRGIANPAFRDAAIRHDNVVLIASSPEQKLPKAQWYAVAEVDVASSRGRRMRAISPSTGAPHGGFSVRARQLAGLGLASDPGQEPSAFDDGSASGPQAMLDIRHRLGKPVGIACLRWRTFSMCVGHDCAS